MRRDRTTQKVTIDGAGKREISFQTATELDDLFPYAIVTSIEVHAEGFEG